MNEIELPMGSKICLCRTCGLEFTSISAFDKHRTGDYKTPSDPRRCMNRREMLAKGMVLNSRGRWASEAWDREAEVG